MKTKAVILAVILLSFLSQVLSQDHQLNLEKYWYYRERLKNDFIYYTGDPTMKGSHQPVECRMNYINVNKADYVRMGDATANLGYYIGLLAIEYRLLKDNGQETDETLLELYNALQAYDRLDLNAENCFRDLPINPLPEDWNGFFIRDDMENDTVLQNYFNVTEINSGYDNCCHQNDSNVVSQDQVIRLFLGLRLAQLMVPDEYVQERTIETAHEIITAMYYMYDLFGLGIDVAVWEIKNPITGEVVPLGGQLIELFPLLWAEAESASNITSEIYGSEHRSWSNSNLTITAWKDAQCNIVNLIQGTIEIEFEIMLYVLGFPVLPFGRITWTEEVGPFNSAMVEELSLLTNDWVQGQDNNLYEWFCGICENTEELYNMPEDVGIFPQFPLLAKLMYGYNGPELIPADYYKIHFFDTAPPCGAHNYKFDERDDITAPPMAYSKSF